MSLYTHFLEKSVCTDILVCIAHFLRKSIIIFLVMGIMWNTLFFCLFSGKLRMMSSLELCKISGIKKRTVLWLQHVSSILNCVYCSQLITEVCYAH